MKRSTIAAALVALLVVPAAPVAVASAADGPSASAAATTKKPAKKKTTKKKPKKKVTNFTVCRRGCPFSTIQKAVDAAPAGATVKIKPGKYTEGVDVKADKDNLTILGLGTKPEEVVLEGKGAKRPDGNPAQNGIFVDGADNVTMRNMTAQNYPANGFFVRNCDGYVMDRLIAGFNRAYGLYAFNCIGGRMTYSKGFGHGDSAFYIGQTPFQENPKPSLISHVEGYENVLGYSGTNSKYVTIQFSEFYNNGAGVAPNTLGSEKFPPAQDGRVTDNLVYWNNFNYFKAGSTVKPLPAATGSFQYPTGVGIVLLGTTNWDIRANLVFGNFKWGIMTVSDPTYAPATNRNNKVRFNVMGAAFDDANGTDVWGDGAGSGNCWENNSAGTTYDAGSLPQPLLYPACGSPQNATDLAQVAEVADYLTKTEAQEDSWKKHPHPPRADRKPIDGLGG